MWWLLDSDDETREREREEEKMNDLIDRRKQNKTKIKQQKQSIESLFKFFGERERKTKWMIIIRCWNSFDVEVLLFSPNRITNALFNIKKGNQ